MSRSERPDGRAALEARQPGRLDHRLARGARQVPASSSVSIGCSVPRRRTGPSFRGGKDAVVGCARHRDVQETPLRLLALAGPRRTPGLGLLAVLCLRPRVTLQLRCRVLRLRPGPPRLDEVLPLRQRRLHSPWHRAPPQVPNDLLQSVTYVLGLSVTYVPGRSQLHLVAKVRANANDIPISVPGLATELLSHH